jgi:hypothetical protein
MNNLTHLFNDRNINLNDILWESHLRDSKYKGLKKIKAGNRYAN